MERKKQWILASALIFMATWALPPSYLGAQETLKVGMIAPFSGPGAPWGAVWKRTAIFDYMIFEFFSQRSLR